MGKVGIIGGTFDPIHNGHLILAQNAFVELGLERVIFMPAFIPPHKQHQWITAETDRVHMVELAISRYPNFQVSQLEIKMQGESYTARTLTELAKTIPELVFIMGADSFVNLGNWYQPHVIFQQAEIACGVREGSSKEELVRLARSYEKKFHGTCHILSMEYFDVSSHEIRAKLQQQQAVGDILPEEVLSYIQKHHLYQESFLR